MQARQIKTVFHYTIGRVYQLGDLRELTPKLKTISSRRVQGHIFHLYREIGTHNLWMEGPFQGSEKHGFMYLGPRQTKSQLRSFLLGEFKSILQDAFEKSTQLLMGRSSNGSTVIRHYDQLIHFDLENF